MNDDELDNWLLEHNSRLVEHTRASVDLDARHKEVLRATVVQAIPVGRVTRARVATRVPARATGAGPSSWVKTLVAAVGVISALASLWMTGLRPHAPSAAVPISTSDRVHVEAQASDVFRQVSGPAGLSTVVPTGWEDAATAIPGEVFEVRDPKNPARILRYGATLAGTTNLSADLDEYESSFAAGKQNYEQIRLAPTTFKGSNAVNWEFLFDVDADGEQRHVYALYWDVGLYRYFIYASAPAAQWDDMLPIIYSVRTRTEVAVGEP